MSSILHFSSASNKLSNNKYIHNKMADVTQQLKNIFEQWHKQVMDGNVEGLMALYHEDAYVCNILVIFI